MALTNLKHLLSEKSNVASIVNAYVFSLGVTVCIQDAEGAVLFGELEQGVPKAEVKLGVQVLGWVSGTHAELVADVLTKLAADDEEHAQTLHQAQEREQALQRQLDSMRIQPNKMPTETEMAKITETEHFRKLVERVEQRRRSLSN